MTGSRFRRSNKIVQKSRTVLFLDSVAATPHVETSIELAIAEALLGSEVFYVPLYSVLPYTTWGSGVNGRPITTYGRGPVEDWTKYTKNILEGFAVFLENIPKAEIENVDPNIAARYITLGSLDFSQVIRSNIIETRKLNFDTSLTDLEQKFPNDLYLALVTAIKCYAITKYLITKLQCTDLYIFNGRLVSNWPSYVAAKELGVSLHVHERGSTKEKYAIYNTPPQSMEESRNFFKNFTMARSINSCIQNAALFYGRQRAGKPAGFGFKAGPLFGDIQGEINLNGREFIVYYTSTNKEVELYPNQDIYFSSRNQFDLMNELARLAVTFGKVLVVRVHPNTSPYEFELITQRVQKNGVILVSPSSRLDSYKLGIAASHRFSIGSTISWEFLYKGYDVAILAKSVAIDFSEINTLKSYDEMIDYLSKPPICKSSEFPTRIGDFMVSFGNQYQLYIPDTLFSGQIDTETVEEIRAAHIHSKEKRLGLSEQVFPD